MHDFSERLQSALSYLENNRKKIKSSAMILRGKNKENIEGAIESNVFRGIGQTRVDGTVCAVDGGLATASSQEVEVFISRAVGIVFNYLNSCLASYQYFPSCSPDPKIEIKIAMDESASRVYGSLFRLEQELEIAIKCISQFRPSVLLLDGSLAVHPADKPSSENEELFKFYERIINKYKQLYELSEKSNCLLIGIAKDSRAKRFSSLVNEHWPDTLFLDYLLRERERTAALRYYGKDNPPPKALEKWAEKIKLSYIKCVKDDYPLRIEFISDNCDLAASTVLSLAAINKTYAYPAILIEADLRAMLDQREVEWILNAFLSRTKPLRSKERPFR